MTEYTFNQLVDIEQVRQLLQSHHRLSGMAYGLFDTDEDILIAVGWQDICVRFHRANPISNARCRESDAYIKKHLLDFEGEFLEYRCKNGMIDVAMPIVIDGEHLATFFTGQFFYDDELPDSDYFITQAEALGFDTEDYLNTLERIPVFSREHIRGNVLFLHNMVKVLAEIGLKNLRLACEMEERKFAEQRLELLGFALDSVHEAAFLMDSSSRFHYVNQEACRSLGYMRDELLGMAIPNIDLDYPKESLPHGLDRRLEQGTLTFETRHRTKDGRIFPVEITSTVLEHNGVQYTLALVRDITERKATQAMLEDERLLLKTLIQTLPDPVWLKDTNGFYITCNTAFGLLYNETPSGIVGRRDNDFVDDELAAFFQQKDREAIAAGRPRTNEEWLTYASDGHLALWETTKTPVYNATGQVVGALGIARDITERKRMEDEVRTSRDYMSNIINAIADPIFVKDAEHRMVLVNNAECALAGCSRDELLGKTDYDVFPKEQVDLFWKIDDHVLCSGEPANVEEIITDADGRTRVIVTHKSLYVDPLGNRFVVGVIRDITRRKQMENALAAREQEFRTLAENSPNIIMRYDLDCRRIYVNPTYELETQVPAQQALNVLPDVQWQDSISMPVEEYKSRLRQVMATGIPAEMEIGWPHRDTGKMNIHALQVVAERNPDGRIVGCLAIGHNISAFKEAEQHLHKREQEFRALVENSPDYIARYDRDCRRVYINPVLERVFGRPAHEVLGMGPTERASLPDAAGYEQAVRGVLENGRECQMEFSFRSAEGEQRWGHMRIVPEFGLDGKVSNVLAIGRDISALKEAEKELRASEQRFRDIFGNSQDCLYLLEVTEDGRFRNLEINPAFERSTGMTRAELIGKYVDETVSEETGAAVVAKYLRCMEAGTVIEEEIELDLPGGHLFFYSTLVPVRDESGRIHRIVGITRDITRRKQAERKLQKALDFSEGVINAIPDLLFEMDRDGRYLNVWTQKPELLAAQKEILLEKTVHDVLSPESAAIVIDSIREAEEKGLSFGNILQIDLPQGPCWFELSVSRKPGGVAADVRFIVLSRDITERKRMEDALAEREKEFRTLAENAPDVIVRYDRECRRIYVNPAFERVNCLSPQEVLGKTPIELSTELAPLAVDFTQHLRKVLETGVPTQIDLAVAKDGIGSSWFVRVIPEFDSNGEVVSALTIWTDITERKRLETALRESELQFRTLAENSPDIIIRYDRECRRVYVNPAYSRETGIPMDQAQNSTPGTLWRAVINMPAQEYMSKLRQVMETAIHLEILVNLRHPDTGQVTSHAFHVVAEHDPEGKITGCLAIGHNITALKEAELRLSKLAAGVPGFLYTYRLRPDGTACLPYASPQIKDIYGFPPETVTEDASETHARIHPDDVSRVRDSIVESARTLSLWRAEYRIRHPEKGDIWVEGRSMPEAQPDGGIVWFGFVHDITERKRIEESLHVKREQLSAMTVELSLAEERERRRIASELHDHIGQTLLLSRIKLGTLADAFESGSDEKTYEEIQLLIERTIRDVRSLTHQLNPPVLASVGLDAALEWLSKRMEADYSLQVDFVDDRNAKPLTEELSSVVYQSARELLINVAKHAGTSEARLTIGREADMLVLTVEDQGSGFECLPDPGTNMPLDCSFGLFNIRQRIKLLGGNVVIESAPGRGTCATIRVPLAAGG